MIATAVHTFLISAVGLEGGETLHYNGTTFSIITADTSAPGSLMRAFYTTPDQGMDWLVLRKDEMITIS